MKAFVTGGSGFIGRSLIRQLIDKGYTVQALARSASSATQVRLLGAQPTPGDITDKESMRAGMAGCDIVFHVAAWYQIGSRDWMAAERINVGGTRNVLTLAVELGIPKIVYTSTVGIFGDTHGAMVNESYYNEGPFLSEYERTKWLAHYKVALPLIEQGAPIVIVLPGGVFGPGDQSIVAEMMRLFMWGLPVLPGPDTTFTYAYVDDIAAGHILAAEKGRSGESYILAGPTVPLDEMVDLCANLTGRPRPRWQIPTSALRPAIPLMHTLGRFIPLPPLLSDEAIRNLGVTFTASAAKARAELGWEPRPLEEGLAETLAWIERAHPRPGISIPVAAGAAMGAAAGLWLARRWSTLTEDDSSNPT